MKLKLKDNNQLINIELPLNTDYGSIVKDDIIISLVLPVNEYLVPKELLDKIVLNETKYSSLIQDIKRLKYGNKIL